VPGSPGRLRFAEEAELVYVAVSEAAVLLPKTGHAGFRAGWEPPVSCATSRLVRKFECYQGKRLRFRLIRVSKGAGALLTVSRSYECARVHANGRIALCWDCKV
jgi:hypothetical protein